MSLEDLAPGIAADPEADPNLTRSACDMSPAPADFAPGILASE